MKNNFDYNRKPKLFTRDLWRQETELTDSITLNLSSVHLKILEDACARRKKDIKKFWRLAITFASETGEKNIGRDEVDLTFDKRYLEIDYNAAVEVPVTKKMRDEFEFIATQVAPTPDLRCQLLNDGIHEVAFILDRGKRMFWWDHPSLEQSG